MVERFPARSNIEFDITLLLSRWKAVTMVIGVGVQTR